MKGIPFRPELHQAIREGRKSQTRRLDHLKEINKNPNDWWLVASFDDNHLFRFANDKLDEDLMVMPRYRIGETVYIKEAWGIGNQWDERKPSEIDPLTAVWYPGQIIKKPLWVGKLRTPLFMPEWAARTFIKITDVRPERLKDITEEDAIAEGINPNIKEHDSSIDLRLKFAWLWDSINGKTYPFDGNFWTWRICFRMLENYR